MQSWKKPPSHFSWIFSPHRVCLVPVVPLVHLDLVDPQEILAVLVSLAQLVSG